MERLQALIDDYVAWIESDKGRKNALQLVLGTGSTADNRPEHETFYRAVGAWAENFAETCPAQTQRLDALRRLLFTAADHGESQAQWYLIAIQNWAKPLIAGLDEQNREILGAEYENRYPKRKRLPLQTEICRMLTGKKGKGFFSFKK